MALEEVNDWVSTPRDNISPHPTGPNGQRATRISLTAQELMAAIARWRNAPTIGDLTTTGDIIMTNLPTSDPAVAGQLWNNSGVLTISSG